MKVPSSFGSKDAGSVAGATVLERHNVVVVGEGPELLFLSHGFGTNQQIWGGILEHLDLQNTYKVIMWDLMGAYSTNPEGFNFQRYSTLHGYADDLLEVLDELGVESCTYIAHSVSGMIGVIASVERPNVFKRLILIGASARYLDTTGYKGGFTLEQLDQVFAAMQDNYKVWASGFAPMVIGEDVESPHVREFCRSLFLIRPDIAFSTLRTIFTCDLRHLLPQVSVQVHLLQTARDAAVPWDAVQYMLDAFPNACVEMVPVAGHLPHLTHPETVSDAILRHLAMPLRQRKNNATPVSPVPSEDAF
uniref:Putative D14 protein n=1 Tax=Spirogyra pratensis TaxID=332123 RepID=I6PFE8_9VIRI|nr:putative D14 protein [Spirogyra pratensis]